MCAAGEEWRTPLWWSRSLAAKFGSPFVSNLTSKIDIAIAILPRLDKFSSDRRLCEERAQRE